MNYRKVVFVLTISEKVRLLLLRRKKTVTWLAGALSMTRQNLTAKLRKNNFTVTELEAIAGALGCEFESGFRMLDTGEKL